MLPNIACYCVLALLAAPDKEKSLGQSGKLLQLRPGTSESSGRRVQFDVRSSGDEEVAEPSTSKTLALIPGRRPVVESDAERHAKDQFVASKYGLMVIHTALFLFLCGKNRFLLLLFVFFSLFLLVIVLYLEVLCCIVYLFLSCIEIAFCPL